MSERAQPGGTKPAEQPGLLRRLGRAYWRISIAMAIAFVIVFTIVLVVGIGMIVVSLPDRSPSGEIVKAGDIAIGGLLPDDCFDLKDGDAPDAQVVYTVHATPCAEAHRFEVLTVSTGHGIGVVSPTEEGVAYFEAECMTAFEPYVGVAPEASALEVRWMRSIDSTFETEYEDGTFLCALSDPNQERLTESLRGSAQ